MKTKRVPISGVFTVVLAYALFAGLWILLSDRAMGLLFSDPDTLVQVSTAKGWLFVAVTSLLLYLLVKRLVGQLDEAHRRDLEYQRVQKQPPPMLVAIAESSDDAIFAKDEEGRYLLFNEAAARFVGKSAAEVLGRDDRALFPPGQAELVMAIDRQVRESGLPATNEEVLQTAAGERVFLATKGPLRGADGRIFGSFGISRDITERKQTEVALRRLVEDMTATLQAIPDLMFEVDSEGRYIKVKASNEALLAAPHEQLVGRKVSDVLPPEAAATVMDALAAASRTGTDYGRAIMLPLASGPCHFELSVARKPAVDGQQDHFIVMSRNITARWATEAALRESEERSRLAQEAARVGIWDWQLDTGNLLWTPELERIYGFTNDTFPGTYQAFADRVYPDDLAEVERCRDEAINAQRPFDFDFRICLPDGAIRWVNCKGGATYDAAGNVRRVFGVNVDITERKVGTLELGLRNQELERFNRAATERESRMIALKREVNELARAAGRPAPYDISFAEEPGATDAP